MPVETNLRLAREMMRIAEQGLYKEFYDYFTDDAIQRVGTGAAEDIIPFFGVVRGRDAMLDSMAIGKDTQFEPIDWRLDCYYAAEDRVFATGSASYRFRATGEEFSTDQTYELVFDNGQCKELIRSVDTAAFYKRQRDYLDSASACWLFLSVSACFCCLHGLVEAPDAPLCGRRRSWLSLI